MKMHAFGRLLPIREAVRRLDRYVVPIARIETVPLASAAGRVAARTVRAPHPVPPTDRASWDGYALRSAPSRSASARQPLRLAVVAELYAENASRRRIKAGEAAAVATGAALPPGADAVAIFEVVRRRGRTISITSPVRRGDRVARRGHDLEQGTVLVRAGERIGPATLGLLAASGLPRVAVYARPTVALLASGNELQLPGRPLTAGGVYECNLPPMAAVVAAAGGLPRPYPPVPDRPERIASALHRALAETDLVLASGGSSVGERDHLPRLFREIGSPLFHGLAVRPGKPTLAARADGKLLIGLPGHPASCLTNMYWLVLPVLRKLARQPGPGWVERTAPLSGEALRSAEGLSTVVPLAFEHGRVRSTFRSSSAITSLSAANGFTILAPGAPTLRAGRPVRFFAFDPPLA